MKVRKTSSSAGSGLAPAGTIDQIGAGVTGFSVGDAVLGFSTLGSYAEWVAVPYDQVVPKPADMPWKIAGGFSGAAQGARNALNQMRVTTGDVVLINGASGSPGWAVHDLPPGARRGRSRRNSGPRIVTYR